MARPKLMVWHEARCPARSGGVGRQQARPVHAARSGVIELRDILVGSEAPARYVWSPRKNRW